MVRSRETSLKRIEISLRIYIYENTVQREQQWNTKKLSGAKPTGKSSMTLHCEGLVDQ
jgi:hypothetical protein